VASRGPRRWDALRGGWSLCEAQKSTATDRPRPYREAPPAADLPIADQNPGGRLAAPRARGHEESQPSANRRTPGGGGLPPEWDSAA
jgi:hypothetical protein